MDAGNAMQCLLLNVLPTDTLKLVPTIAIQPLDVTLFVSLNSVKPIIDFNNSARAVNQKMLVQLSRDKTLSDQKEVVSVVADSLINVKVNGSFKKSEEDMVRSSLLVEHVF